METKELIGILTIPLFSGVIGYATNWTGIWMLFYPVKFKGFRMPGLASLAHIFPRRIQQIPGIMVGGIGWQGIIPSRAAKMGSIATDKGIAKVGSPSDFYSEMDPERLADHIIDSSRDDIRAVIDEVIEREHPQLWRDLTPELKERIHRRIEEQFPDMVREVTDEIGRNIDQLLDVKLMVIRRIEEHPELANKIFKSVGDRELKMIIRFGFYFGFALGIPVAGLTAITGSWMLLICGPIVGWVTNWLAILLIFEPVEPKRYLFFKHQGYFIQRQHEASDTYAEVIADDIITIENIGEELMRGSRSDRTRQMIATKLRPAIDRAVGRARPAVRLAVGPREYDAIRESIAFEGVDHTMTPLSDRDFNRRQGRKVRSLIADRMRDMPPADFSEMLRSAMREDEWLLLAHGAVLGIFGGLLHLAAFA